MTEPRTTPDGPLYLGMAVPEPDPVSGCAACAQLARQREAARTAGDDTRVSDCNVWLRRHPGHERKLRR
ncbi:hypothetical protein AB0L04_22355 [Streptomyces glaucescens]|uniref:hypothetical protein n=1 Tax=Streptomyces glaucescens TaxID=1907 RepID=UPI00344B93F2